MSSENCFCLSKATSQIGAKAEIFDNLYFVFRLGRVSAFSTRLLNSGEPSYAVVGSAGASPSHGPSCGREGEAPADLNPAINLAFSNWPALGSNPRD